MRDSGEEEVQGLESDKTKPIKRKALSSKLEANRKATDAELTFSLGVGICENTEYGSKF